MAAPPTYDALPQATPGEPVASPYSIASQPSGTVTYGAAQPGTITYASAPQVAYGQPAQPQYQSQPQYQVVGQPQYQPQPQYQVIGQPQYQYAPPQQTVVVATGGPTLGAEALRVRGIWLIIVGIFLIVFNAVLLGVFSTFFIWYTFFVPIMCFILGLLMVFRGLVYIRLSKRMQSAIIVSPHQQCA